VTYVLEFGQNYLAFITEGGSVVEPAFGITAITNSTAATATAPGHNYTNGQMVFISGALGMPQVNNRYFTVNGIAGNVLGLYDPFTGVAVNSSAWGTYGGSGSVQRVYSISTPYLSSELALLKFSQKASQLNITHPNHPPYVLSVISATNWTLVAATFGATIAAPVISAVTPTPAGAIAYDFLVTTVDTNNQESVASAGLGTTTAVDMRLTAGSIAVTWGAVTGAFAYNIYATSPSYSGAPGSGALHGFVGTIDAGTTTFIDTNISPDFSTTPPIHNSPFVGPDANPQVSAYFQQRLVYANAGGSDVDKFWMSKPGNYYNFDISNPAAPDDSIDARLVSLEVNEIKSMIPMPSGLVMLTTRGAWQISGGAGGVATQGGPITPTSLTATSQAYIGANDVPPILVNYDIFFIQQKGSIVRNLSYNIYANIYTGMDASIMSSHLFYGHQVLEWAYAEEPFKVIWAVREDGILLSFTIVKEQEMFGWARHDTLGNFKSVCTVTEGSTDAAYVQVDRPLPNGKFVKFIERIAERTFDFGAEDAWSVDCGVTTGHNTPNANLSIFFGVPGNVIGGTASIIADASVFNSGMVGWVLRAGGGRFTVTTFASPSSVAGTVIQPMTTLLTDDPLNRPNIVTSGHWSIDQPFATVYGLSHLEGQQVSVLADGGVVNGLTVSNGSVTLPVPVTNVTAGLGFQAQLQTMYLDLGQEANTIQGKRKKIGALTVRCKDSRGLKAGRTFSHLVPIKELNRTTTLGLSIPLVTADERIIMDPLWDVPGQICLQVDDPLPATVLGVIPEVVIGDTPK